MASATLPPPGPPNLGNVITAADVSRKGNGSYAADYVNWCRVGQLLRDHAPGWQFHLRSTPDGNHVWTAPNGTGYVVGYFVGPDGQETPDFPQAVMDNRNAPVAMDRITARDVTDTHRRCLCTAAAAAFGLAWQLWAKEPIEDPHRPPQPAPRILTTTEDLTAGALRACEARGLTPAGLVAMCQEISGGEAISLEQLQRNHLARLAKSGITQESAARWNAAGEALTEPAEDPDDLPAAWTEAEPVTA
jgi:hypothetical protein